MWQSKASDMKDFCDLEKAYPHRISMVEDDEICGAVLETVGNETNSPVGYQGYLCEYVCFTDEGKVARIDDAWIDFKMHKA